jgi:general secretion pathway protein A
MLRDLARALVDERARGQRVVAVIDEAQNLSMDALEELRMLSNLETEKSKLMQIVLVGQPQLRDKLSMPELEQLRQRVTVRYHIEPLDQEETANYINHRLRRAALGAPLEMSREVTDAVHEWSGGIPRLINVICDGALLFGYAEEQHQIDLPLLNEVFEELAACNILRPPGSVEQSAPTAAPTVPFATADEGAIDRVRLLSDQPAPAARPAYRPQTSAAANAAAMPRTQAVAAAAPAPAMAQGRPIPVRQITLGGTPAPPLSAPAAPQRSGALEWMKELLFGRPSAVRGG